MEKPRVCPTPEHRGKANRSWDNIGRAKLLLHHQTITSPLPASPLSYHFTITPGLIAEAARQLAYKGRHGPVVRVGGMLRCETTNGRMYGRESV